jgi:hypothetical protein
MASITGGIMRDLGGSYEVFYRRLRVANQMNTPYNILGMTHDAHGAVVCLSQGSRPVCRSSEKNNHEGLP